MKILNFTATEVLPALLDRSKTQTIRPAFKKVPTRKLLQELGCKPRKLDFTVGREARFKVGEEVKLMWNQRSRYGFFCSCGDNKNGLMNFCVQANRAKVQEHVVFNKCLGFGKIAEVFKIDMCVGNDAPFITGYTLKQRNELALRDGFKSGDEMVVWFMKRYGLDDPKLFWVYRWEWEK